MKGMLYTVIGLFAICCLTRAEENPQDNPITPAPIKGVYAIPASFYGGGHSNGAEVALSYDGNVVANLQDHRNRGGQGKLLNLSTGAQSVFFDPKDLPKGPRAVPQKIRLSFDGSVVAFPTEKGVAIRRMTPAHPLIHVDMLNTLWSWNKKTRQLFGNPVVEGLAMNDTGTVLYAVVPYVLDGDRTSRRAVVGIDLGTPDGSQWYSSPRVTVMHSAYEGEMCFPFNTLTTNASGKSFAFKGADANGKGMHCWVWTGAWVPRHGFYMARDSEMAGNNKWGVFRGGPIMMRKEVVLKNGQRADSPWIIYHKASHSRPVTFYNWGGQGRHLLYCQESKGAPSPDYTDGFFMSHDANTIVYTHGTDYVWYDMLAKAHWLRPPGVPARTFRPVANNFMSANGRRLLLRANPTKPGGPQRLVVVDMGGVSAPPSVSPPPSGTPPTPGPATSDTAKELAEAEKAFEKAKHDYALIIRARQTDTPQGRQAKIAYIRAENRLNIARKKHAEATRKQPGGTGNPDDPDDGPREHSYRVAITPSAATGKPGEQLSFKATMNRTPVNGTFRWDWGAGETPTEGKPLASASTAYAKPGKYTITLTVYNAYSKRVYAAANASVTITAPTPQPPVVKGPLKIGDPVDRTETIRGEKWLVREWHVPDVSGPEDNERKNVARPMKIVVRHTDCGRGFGVLTLDRQPKVEASFSTAGQFPTCWGYARIYLKDPTGSGIASHSHWFGVGSEGSHGGPFLRWQWTSRTKPAPVPGTQTIDFKKDYKGSGSRLFLTVPLALVDKSTPTPPSTPEPAVVEDREATVRITAACPGVPDQVEVRTHPRTPDRVDVSGIVQGLTAEQLREATVTVAAPALPSRKVSVGADGRYSAILGVPEAQAKAFAGFGGVNFNFLGRHLKIRVERDGYVPRTVTVRLPKADHSRVIINGRVTDAETKKPIAGAATGIAWNTSRRPTDVAGKFLVVDTADGDGTSWTMPGELHIELTPNAPEGLKLTIAPLKPVYERGEAVTLKLTATHDGKPLETGSKGKMRFLFTIDSPETGFAASFGVSPKDAMLKTVPDAPSEYTVMPFAGWNLGTYEIACRLEYKPPASQAPSLKAQARTTFSCVAVEDMRDETDRFRQIVALYKATIPTGPTRGQSWLGIQRTRFAGSINNFQDIYHRRVLGSTKHEYFVCGGYQGQVLGFFDHLRFHDDPRKRALLRGFDYAPVSRMSHKAVIFYRAGEANPRRLAGLKGWAFDPWPTQTPEVIPLEKFVKVMGISMDYSMTFSPDSGPGMFGLDFLDIYTADPNPANVMNTRSYPLNGNCLYGHPDLLGGNVEAPPVRPKTAVAVNCPVTVLITDGAGKRTGILPNGKVVYEIPILIVRGEENGETTGWYYELPEGDFQTSVTGTANGTFRVSFAGEATNGHIMDYGDQPIRKGERVILSIPRGSGVPVLTLGDGSRPNASRITQGLSWPLVTNKTLGYAIHVPPGWEHAYINPQDERTWLHLYNGKWPTQRVSVGRRPKPQGMDTREALLDYVRAFAKRFKPTTLRTWDVAVPNGLGAGAEYRAALIPGQLQTLTLHVVTDGDRLFHIVGNVRDDSPSPLRELMHQCICSFRLLPKEDDPED